MIQREGPRKLGTGTGNGEIGFSLGNRTASRSGGRGCVQRGEGINLKHNLLREPERPCKAAEPDKTNGKKSSGKKVGGCVLIGYGPWNPSVELIATGWNYVHFKGS